MTETHTTPVLAPPGSPRNGRMPSWMLEVREEAGKRFQGLRWPDPSEEEWRRTDLSRHHLDRFIAAGQPSEDDGAACVDRLVNGLAGSISPGADGGTQVALDPAAAHRGVRLVPLRDAPAELVGPVRGILRAAAAEADNRLVAWHFSLLSEGVLLYVPPSVEVPEPFLFTLADNPGAPVRSPHLIVILGEGASAAIIQRSGRGAPAAGERVWNAGADIVLHGGASLALHEIQELGPGALVFRNTRVRLKAGARFSHWDAAFGGSLVKTRLEALLDGEGADARLNGVYFAGRGQHMDLRTVQRHLSPAASSRGFYKGAVRDNGRAVFQGLIEVAPNAARTDAYLTNRNLVLNDGARSDSIPSLKIGNNDVRCSHGSTTGRIDEDQLFYLRSRGFSRAQAREMLVTGYFEELLGDTPEPYSARVLDAVRARLQDGERRADG
jgi:Fe-S cluster assembly protein SufD